MEETVKQFLNPTRCDRHQKSSLCMLSAITFNIQKFHLKILGVQIFNFQTNSKCVFGRTRNQFLGEICRYSELTYRMELGMSRDFYICSYRGGGLYRWISTRIASSGIRHVVMKVHLTKLRRSSLSPQSWMKTKVHRFCYKNHITQT